MATSPLVDNESAEKLLPSGRSVVVKLNEGREELQIRAPDGAVEVQIVLTESGPVVRLHGARLELAATETVAVDCKRFEVHTSEATKLESDGELRVKTADDVHINGKFIRLNC